MHELNKLLICALGMSICVDVAARRKRTPMMPDFQVAYVMTRYPLGQDEPIAGLCPEQYAIDLPLAQLSAGAQAYRDSIQCAWEKKMDMLAKRHGGKLFGRLEGEAYYEGYEAGYEDGINRGRNESFAPKTKTKPYYTHYCNGYFEGYHDGYMDTVEDYAIDGIEEDDDEDWELEDWEE